MGGGKEEGGLGLEGVDETGEGEVEGGPGGNFTRFMHSRSLETIDPRTPTRPGRNSSSLHRPGRNRVHQARSAVRCSGSRMKGELHPSQNRS